MSFTDEQAAILNAIGRVRPIAGIEFIAASSQLKHNLHVGIQMKKSWPLDRLIWSYSGTLIAVSMASIGWGLLAPLLKLNENQVLYLFSTSAQVIAAIYGLTLTGFLFFRNELSREAAEDETLAEAIGQLKSRYFSLLVFITLLVGLTLFLSNAAISYEADARTTFTTILINAGQSALAVSFVAIAVFVFDVIAPQRIEKASQKLKDDLDPATTRDLRGSLEIFLTNYNRIEALLIDAGALYQSGTMATYESRSPKRMSNARLAELLVRSERIDKTLFHNLRELITLRNAIIHGAEPVVSQEIVNMSAQVLAELQASLNLAFPQ